MTASILVATPHPAFGELLRSSLEENGKYRVHVSLSAREARASSLHSVFQLAILDFALSDEPFIPLCFDLLDQQKGLRLVVVPPENNPNHPALGGLMPHGYLSRPFYLPDLLETVSRLLDERAQAPSGAGSNGHLPGRAPVPAAGLSYTLPGWLVDPKILTNYLSQQLPLTQALAILVGISDVTPGSGVLHASAGRLNPAAAQEMTGVVFRYWNRSKKADLMRFVRLNSEKMDYLIYATPLAGELVLTLVYDTSSPLSQVRPQTKTVAQALAATPPEGFVSDDAKAGPAAGAAGAPEAGQTAGSESASPQAENIKVDDASRGNGKEPPSTPKPAAQEPETQPLDDPLLFELVSPTPVEAPTPPPVSVPDIEETSDEGENPVINLSSLLGTIPQPDPGTEVPQFSAQTGFNGWQPDSGFGYEPAESQAVEPPQTAGTTDPAASQPAASQPATSQSAATQSATAQPAAFAPGQVEAAPQKAAAADQNDAVEDLAAPAPAKAKFTAPASAVDTSLYDDAIEDDTSDEDYSGDTVAPYPARAETAEPAAAGQIVLGSEPAIDPLEDTRPRVMTAISSLNQLEPVSPALSLLNYTCVLVPRLPQHYLTGELADRLSHWVQQLCLAFGWRLEGISVRPEYLQWTLQVAPSVSPGNLVRIIRQRTSNSIFSHFAHLAEQNPSGDFWATGYLIVSGAQPPSAQLLRDYISQTRKRQGIAR